MNKSTILSIVLWECIYGLLCYFLLYPILPNIATVLIFIFLSCVNLDFSLKNKIVNNGKKE